MQNKLTEANLTNYVDKAIAKQKAEKEAQEKRKELSIQELKSVAKACRQVFGTKNGMLVARAMMRVSGIYKTNKNSTNMFEIGKERGREEMYLFFVKQFLNADTIAQIEKRIEKEEV
ncbi:MAG: hypothetical protein ACTSXE_00785 [Candidatus Thorarchaeota archaeon]